MASNWFHGQPQRNFDGRSAERAALLALVGADERRAKAAYGRCILHFGKEIVNDVMVSNRSDELFPTWNALADAFERMEKASLDALDAAFCGWTEQYAFEDTEAAAVADDRAEMRASLRQF